MKKTLMLFVSAYLLTFGSAYAAPDRVGKTDLGVEVSGAFLSEDEGVDSAVYVGGNLSYGIKPWFAVGGSFGWQSFGSDDATSAGVTVPGPDLTAYPLFGDLIFRVPQDQLSFVPYGVVGLGAIFWNVDDITASNGVSVKTDVDTSFGVKLGGGIDWFINEHWILNFNGQYVFTDANVTARASGAGVNVSATEKSDLDYWNIGGGLKFVF